MGVLTADSTRATIIDGTNAVPINQGVANDTRLLGIVFHTALTGTCVIAGFKKRAGSVDASGTITFPASSPAGYRDLRGIVNEDGPLTITCSNAGDDEKVIVLWTPNP